MKNLILITFLFMAFQGKAQTTKPIDGFLGIKFGSTAAQVIEALKAKGAILNKERTNEKLITFDNVTLSGRKSVAFFVNLVNGQAYRAQFVFKPEVENKTIEYYVALVDDINGVYGTGKTTKTFKQPYTDGDGYEITAIKTGNANYATLWTATENEIEADITANAEGSIRIRLYYVDSKLDAINDNQKKEKNKSEF